MPLASIRGHDGGGRGCDGWAVMVVVAVVVGHMTGLAVRRVQEVRLDLLDPRGSKDPRPSTRSSGTLDRWAEWIGASGFSRRIMPLDLDQHRPR